MAYKKRLDGRKFDELRPIEAKVGVIKNAAGSYHTYMSILSYCSDSGGVSNV